jgi:hypothetical protein
MGRQGRGRSLYLAIAYSDCLIELRHILIRDVLGQVAQRAIEVTAKPIQMVSKGAVSPLIHHLRQSHPADVGGICKFRKRDTTTFTEVFVS